MIVNDGRVFGHAIKTLAVPLQAKQYLCLNTNELTAAGNLDVGSG